MEARDTSRPGRAPLPSLPQ